VVAQQPQPGIEGAGHHGREQAVAGHQVEAELPVRLDGRPLRRDALPADHLDGLAPGAVQDDRQIAARTVQMRLDHLEREARRDRGVERVAAALEGGHAGRRGQPMGRGHDPERAQELGAGGEAWHGHAPDVNGAVSDRRRAAQAQLRVPARRSKSTPSYTSAVKRPMSSAGNPTVVLRPS
jgi:hypothetical protein